MKCGPKNVLHRSFFVVAFQNPLCSASWKKIIVSRNLAQNFEHTAADEMPFRRCVINVYKQSVFSISKIDVALPKREKTTGSEAWLKTLNTKRQRRCFQKDALFERKFGSWKFVGHGYDALPLPLLGMYILYISRRYVYVHWSFWLFSNMDV